MQKIASTLRIAILLALGTAATILIFGGDPGYKSHIHAAAFIVAHKTLGMALCWCAARLYKRWRHTDKWLAAYHRHCTATPEEQ